ncbi:hypothetical protein EZ456_15935 [Pedobacter psychrodurus]|uniref:Lipoprotein n=1 Tax=Pedobacter psychrodurus TaxID=2530456 RepID=A0A4R0PVA5_9SPHI|nr:hypothetical protein [Pedobacter psychrodurus]TCD25517.1 hypothetical protein EZ456_15935 [Pedobacter psychrodurus]
MKNLTNISSLMILCCFLGFGCKQIKKSVDETFHPNDSLVRKYNKENHFGTNGEYTGTTKTTTSTQHHQEKIVVINGDTVNTTELQGKAKDLFHDIELLKQKQTPANGKEIQKRVNEFLKEMNLPPTGKKNIGAEKTVVKAKEGMLTASELQQAEEKLRKLPQYHNKEIMMYESVHFYEDGSINLALQHPENPKYVDAYKYKDGSWSEPKPVLARNIERRTFPLSKMNFADAQKVIQIYNDKAAEIEGAKPTTTVYISIWDNGMRWFPSTINGSRERYDLQFNNDGTLKSFRQE